MVSASSDNTLAFYPGPFKKLGGSSKDHKNIINSARFSPNGERLVTVGLDKSIYMYSGTEIALQGPVGEEGKAHDKGIVDVHWIGDGHFITCSNDCSVKLWDAEERVVQRTLRVDAHQKDKFGNMQVGCAASGDSLFSVSLCGDLNVWGSLQAAELEEGALP